MNNREYPFLQKPQPLRQTHHRKETIWQIVVPVIFGGLGLIFGGAMIAGGTDVSVSQWGNLSAIWLLIPCLLLSLLPLVAIIALIVGIERLFDILPPALARLQNGFERGAKMVEQGTNRAVEPMMRMKSTLSGVKSLIKRKY